MNWIGQLLGGVSRISHRRGQPMLSALCVHSDGTVGEGYGQAILENFGGPLPGDLDMHAAGERLRCYQSFGGISHPGGGRPALTPPVAAHRAWLARQSRAGAPVRLCPSCNIWHSQFRESATTVASYRQPPGATTGPATNESALVTKCYRRPPG
jgi:hypothetical protein